MEGSWDELEEGWDHERKLRPMGGMMGSWRNDETNGRNDGAMEGS